MTLQQQAREMIVAYQEWENLVCDDYEQLQTFFEDELRKAFRAGQRAGQERSGIQPSLATLACERCTFLFPKLTYHKGTRLLLCDACKDAVDREKRVVLATINHEDAPEILAALDRAKEAR